MAALNSDELNFLVVRYLHEQGFRHSAFAFACEASIENSPIDGSVVPYGALITLVQNGRQYLQMEAALSNSDKELDEDISLIQPMELINKDVGELRKIVIERKKNKQKEGDNKFHRNYVAKSKCSILTASHHMERDREEEKQGAEKGKEPEVQLEDTAANEIVVKTQVKLDLWHGVPRRRRSQVIKGVEQRGISKRISHSPQIPSPGPSGVTILTGHSDEVYACSWNPKDSVLASVQVPFSRDTTARIWSISEMPIIDGINKSGSQNEDLNAVVLKHVRSDSNEKISDIPTLDWNEEGTLLATGSSDGQARIWNSNGELMSILGQYKEVGQHKGHILSLKWNKKGDYILTGSSDSTAIVWDMKTEACKQQFEFHRGPILDVDWRNNVSFATSSTDGMIYACKVGENFPAKIFAGHQGEVNSVKWDPTGTLLASGSDDTTAKIWSIRQDKYVHDLREHAKEIYAVRWSPSGPGSNNPNQQLLLASASCDSTVKLWDVELGKVLCTFEGHRNSVYSLAFSPNGEYLATGSWDCSLHIYSLKEEKIVKTYNGKGGIFKVCWNREGNKVAGCSADGTIGVVDFRM